MFHTLFYEPLYNLLVLVLTYTPLHDIGTAIVIVTVLVKLVLLPINLAATRTQYLMKRVEGEMKELKEKHKENPHEASKKMMELYKREQINPFAGIFALILQIPILLALYFVFSKGLSADVDSLYSFVHFPETLHTLAFGLFDVKEKNIVIAVLAGVASYFLARRQTESMIPQNKGGEETFQDQFMRSMRIQLLYVLPVIITISASFLPSALGLYWFVSSVIGYAQDVYVKNKLAHLQTA